MSNTREQRNHPGDVAEALRALPAVMPDELQLARWTKVAQRRQRQSRWRPWTLAASLCLAVLAASAAWHITDRDDGGAVQVATAPAIAEDESLTSLVAEAALLEQALAAMPSEGRVRRVSDAGAIASLEDRLASIDAVLYAPEQAADAVALWQERVGVMSALVSLKQGAEPALWL
ncbi:MAG: hypothetical protein AAGF46_05345 [Pseudomonadota bacterium]